MAPASENNRKEKNMSLKKGAICETVIKKVLFANKGIGKAEGETIVVKNGIPGQKVRVLIRKKRSSHYTGSLLEVLEPSPLEIREPFCSNYPRCGGCTYQTMGYENQLEMKYSQVKELMIPVFEKAGISKEQAESSIFEGIAHAKRELPFRNKMEYTFGDETKGGELTLGLHKKDSMFDILLVTDCAITHQDFNQITECTLNYCREQQLPYYHRMSHEGYLRNLLIRRGEYTGEILVAVVTSTQREHDFEEWKKRLLSLELEGSVTGILQIFYDGVADVVRSDRTEILYGRDYIYDELMGLRFRIGAFSFSRRTPAAQKCYMILYGIILEI